MISLFIWLVMGALVGWVASVIMQPGSEHGTVRNIVVGIIGGAVGGVVFRALGLSGYNINQGVTGYSFAVSVLGAVAFLAVMRVARGGSASEADA